MGNCLHRSAVVSNRSGPSSWGSPAIAVGDNQPLKRGPLRWCSSPPIFESQLQQKRDEFWDTSPAFDGRQEIWGALRSAAEAAERGDHELAQAIVDSADIILPTGTLSECYDALGNRYQLPLFVLSRPTNLELDTSVISHSVPPQPPTGAPSSAAAEGQGDTVEQQANIPQVTENPNESVTVVNLPSLHLHPVNHRPSSSNQSHRSSSSSPQTLRGPFSSLSLLCANRRRVHTLSKKTRRKGASARRTSVRNSCQHFVLHVRLSTGAEFAIPVTGSQTVLEVKRHLSNLAGWLPDRQRWYCAGVALRDALRIADCPPSIAPPLSFVVQVVVHSPLDPESSWLQQKQNQVQQQ